MIRDSDDIPHSSEQYCRLEIVAHKVVVTLLKISDRRSIPINATHHVCMLKMT